jgi:hypothetical protein
VALPDLWLFVDLETEAEAGGCVSLVGFVVIEYNQASHWPDVYSDGLYAVQDDAEYAARSCREIAAQNHRGEQYKVAEVRLVEELVEYEDLEDVPDTMGIP